MPKLADLYSLKDETAAEIFSLTAGLPELLSAYDLEKSLEENVRSMLHKDSVFYCLAADWMSEYFRTPESYNTLLYGMAEGKNRINELSAFSGYPKNKCDKYIKALMEHGLVRREDGSFEEEIVQNFLDYFRRTVMKDFYRRLCIHWLESNLNHNTSCYIHTDDISLYDVKVGGICFDFAFTSDIGYYAYFDCILREGLTGRLWEKNRSGYNPAATVLQKRILSAHREPGAGQFLEPQQAI